MLCYFEGLTHEQAANRLHWPLGTVKIRLSRGRERLRTRLKRRERESQFLFPANPLRSGSFKALPEHIVKTIMQAASRKATNGIAGGLVSTAVAKATQGVMRSMLFDKLKMAAVVMSGLFLLGYGGLIAAQQATGNGATSRPRNAAIVPRDDFSSKLKLAGMIDYDPATVTEYRAPFDTRVDKVLADVGSTVKAGDSLLEFFSADLAESKSNYEAATSQWVHDKQLLAYKAPLVTSNNLLTKALIDAENAAAQSRLQMKLAKDKLLIYGLSEKEIENVKNEDGVQRAKISLLSRAAGVVVSRSATRGNYYARADLLMTIARLDHLWVRGSIPESHAAKAKVGQKLKINIPGYNRTVDTTVDYIDRAIDAESRSAKFRATISNSEGWLKAGMFARLVLETGSSRAAIDEARGPDDRPLVATINDRLRELETKVDQLLGETRERSTHGNILKRLDSLERKLDRLLDRRKDSQE